MSELHLADAVLRRFLLGRVDDEQRQGIESLFVTDDSFNERLRSLEQDLIDDYFEGALSRPEAESFRRQYAGTASQRQKLDVSKSVKDWANEQVPREVGAKAHSFRSLIRPSFVVPAAAGLLIATVLLVLWTRYRVETRNHNEMQQELVRVNRPPALAETPDRLTSITLSPVNTRTTGSQTAIDSGNTQLVELRLLWIKEGYPSYRVVLRGVNSGSPFAVEDLQAAGDLIRLRIPGRLLTRGQFRVTLTGISADRSEGLSEEYWFSVPQ